MPKEGKEPKEKKEGKKTSSKEKSAKKSKEKGAGGKMNAVAIKPEAHALLKKLCEKHDKKAYVVVEEALRAWKG